MDMYVMNGTNSVVPMNGTNSVVPMNGYGLDDEGYSFEWPMNGTNSVVPMNGTNSVVPMQGTGGDWVEVEIDPWALLDESDVPMNGIPDDYDEDDMEVYRLAYLAGDPDAMQGLFKRVKQKVQQARAGNKAAKQDRRERRAERRELRAQNRQIRTEKRAKGEGFLDRVGGFLGNLGEAKRIAAEATTALDDAGIEYDPDIIEQRAALAADAGASADDVRMTRSADGGGSTGGGGLMAWWNSRPTNEKVVYGALAVGGLYVGYKMLTGQPVFGGKKRKK